MLLFLFFLSLLYTLADLKISQTKTINAIQMDYHSPSLYSTTLLGLINEDLFFLNYVPLSFKEPEEIFKL